MCLPTDIPLSVLIIDGWIQDTKTATGRSFFPHIYANDDKEGEKGLRLRLGSGEIERIGEWFRSPDGGWRVEDWPFGDEDRPSAL